MDNRHTQLAGGAIIGIIALLLVTVVIIVAATATKEAPDPQISSIATEDCEVGHVNPDGSISITEESAGEYGYTIYATAEGMKIMGKCN